MKTFTKIILTTLLLMLSSYMMAQNFGLDLDGANDKIGVQDATELNPTGPFTMEVWINADSWESAIHAGAVIDKQATSPDRGYNITVGEAGRAQFTVSIDGVWKSAATNAIMGLNTWYHIAGVYDGSSVSIYINGILQASSAVSGSADHSTGTDLYFGENPTWSGRYFDGTLDEVRIWDYAKTAADILNQYTIELTGSETDLLAYWPMNEGTGTAVGDFAPGGNNALMFQMDANTDWVDGFVAPGSDVGVLGIVSPALIGPAFTDQEKVTVDIKNFSTEEASNFEVSYQIDGGTIITETISTTLAAFETMTHTFSSTVDLLGSASVDVNAFTNLTNDANAINDGVSSTISPTEQYDLFDGELHNNGSAGQTQTTTAYVTEYLDQYSQILLNVSLACPSPGGCDPWDQAAQIWLNKNGVKYEIGRYITPYGIACGGWTFDITDFKSLLSGRSEIESYIQVWGASGWNVNVEIELVTGTPDYLYSKVDILWNENYFVYGDPIISHDLPVQTVNIDSEAESVKLRLTNTGHGQGNTLNAAEFLDVTHQLVVDGGSQTIDHTIWKDDCSSNTCSPQAGTWQYPRAGWCPGQDVQPDVFDFTSDFTAGGNMTFDYVLANYTNLETDYSGDGHTEPFYRIMGYLVTYSNSPLSTSNKGLSTKNQKFKIFPNPNNGDFNIEFNTELSNVSIDVVDMLGSVVYQEEISSLNADQTKQIKLSELAKGIYTIRVNTDQQSYIQKIIVKK